MQLILPVPTRLSWKQFPAKGVPYKLNISREPSRRYIPAAVLFVSRWSMAYTFLKYTG